MDESISAIADKDAGKAYELVKKLGAESAVSDRYLRLVPELAGLLSAGSSYVRTRAFYLICCQARWASGGQLEAVFDRMAPLLNDPKPTVVRQCLQALREVALFRPELADRIRKAVTEIDPERYRGSMSPLVRNDMDDLLRILG